ncbi:MAG: acetyl-CoA C-acyltransferase [Cyclobacteriaceae bacterium]|nr:acetyl-CoA C-acyltransferase [Cyclobacteriaceae bacterium]
MQKLEDVFIVATRRTAIGSFNGALSSFSAIQLGSMCIRAVVEESRIPAKAVEELFMGNVVSANLGQAPARQAALGAGLSHNTPCTTVNKVCASGMKALMLGAQSIMLGTNNLVVAGGMESMSNIPYYLPKARQGYRYGNGELVDGLLKDGLWEPYHQFPMGNCAENTAREMQISREAQDAYAIASYQRAQQASQKGYFKNEITPVHIEGRKGEVVEFSEDEEPGNVRFDKIPQLRPVFQKDGTVTAANASTISDGAAALMLASEKAVKEYNLRPIARIAGFADAAQEPIWFTTSPALAIPKAMKNASISPSEVDYYEINEAFAVVCIANNHILSLDPEKVNVFGGAISLGHPIGTSGARIIGTLCNVLATRKGKWGVAGICNGGGGASAMVIENLI